MCLKIIAVSIASCLTLLQSANAFVLEEATISNIHTNIKNHQITCASVISDFLNRIKNYNLSAVNHAPLNAFTYINQVAMDDARKLDNDFAQSGQMKGPLHCIPVVLKDNIDSFDTITSAGSYALLGNQPVNDADLTARLRAAGAIIIGKGGMDEFAWGMFGFSSRSGRIGNVYDTTKNPGGSSGGTAVAISANFAMVGVGTDNSGSVRIPAVFNGLVAIRPTAGLISQQGIFPMGNLDGTAGPMARTVTDLAILLDVIATRPASSDQSSYTSHLTSAEISGKHIGLLHRVGKVDLYKNISPDVQSAINAVVQTMQAHGVTFVNVDLPEFNNDRSNNQAGEIEDVNAYLAAFPAVRKDFKDICESDRTRNFGDVKACLKFINSVPAKNSKQYQNVLNDMQKNRDYVEKIMKDKKLDAVLMPFGTQPAGSYDGNTVNLWQAAVSSNAGLPAIDFVIGYDKNNMPIGVDLTGPRFSEGTLIAIAYGYEQLTHLRHVPAMPDANNTLLMKSIPQYNNLIAEIGKDTYDKLILPAKPGENDWEVISADKFKKIVNDDIRRNV